MGFRKYLTNLEERVNLRDSVARPFRESPAPDAMSEALEKARVALSARKTLIAWRDFNKKFKIVWASGVEAEEMSSVFPSDGVLSQLMEEKLPKFLSDPALLKREFGGLARSSSICAPIWNTRNLQTALCVIDIDGLSFEKDNPGLLEGITQEIANILKSELNWSLQRSGFGIGKEKLENGECSMYSLYRGTKWVAIIFADLRGSTPAIEIMGLRAGRTTDRSGRSLSLPEPADIINDFCGRMAEKACMHGRVEKLVGDSVTCIVGDLIEEPDERRIVLRAVCTATAMYDAFRELSSKWKHDWISDFRKIHNEDVSLRLGIGINYGPAFFDFYGSSDYKQYMGIGDTANTAQRLEELANKPREANGYYEPILISQTMMAQMAQLDPSPITFSPYVLDIRGKAWPIPAYGVKTFDRSECRKICEFSSRHCKEGCKGGQWSLGW